MLKNLLFLSIITTLAIVALIGFNYYHNTTTSAVPEFIATKNVPIVPKMDTKTAENLSNRNIITVNLHDKNISVQPTATPNKITVTNSVSSPEAGF